MVKINMFKRKDNGEYKYSINLPKEVMESLEVLKGDELLFIGEIDGELRFKLRRKIEIDNLKIKLKEDELKYLKDKMVEFQNEK